MAAKLGLQAFREGDEGLFARLFDLMEGQVDFTNCFRALSHLDLESDGEILRDSFPNRSGFDAWLTEYRQRLQAEATNPDARRKQMLAINPKYILRNYLGQQSIMAAEKGDFGAVETLHAVLQSPFDEQPAHEEYADDPPDWARHIDLSCSS
jgi:uncharacterized protein YdiU (UPF0061 family)